MHVLLVGLHRFTQPFGFCRYTANLFLSLKRVKSLRVTLVLGKWQREYYERALKLDVDDPDIIWVDLKRPAVSRYFWYLRGVPQLARKLNVGVVHAAFPMPFVKAWFACPIVTTMHDLYAYDAPESIGFPNVWLNRFVLRLGISSSSAIISISRSSKDSLLKWFPYLDKRIPLPVIYQEVRPRTTAMVNSMDSTRGTKENFLLCVAQHRKNKNLDLTIEAYYKALDAGVIDAGTNLVIVGSEGPETENLRSLARQRVGVRFLSGIPDEQLFGLYKSCKAFVCASSIEGFCIPVAEALSFSCRVICSDIPVLREVAGEQGTFFSLEPRSPEALVEAIQHSLKSRRRTGLRAELLQAVSGDQVVHVYSSVLN